MQMTVDGLVIREKMLSNDNRLVTILTGEYGLVRTFVRSVKKLGGTMAAATDLFSYSSFTLFYNKDQYSADGAEPLRIFYHLREDLEKTSLASYLAQLAEELVPQGEPTPEQLKLFLNCLHLLEEDKRTVDFIKPVFELRLLTMSGYMPDLVGCQGCGEYEAEQFFFSPATGTLLCGHCANGMPPQGSISLTRDQLAAMRHIIYSQANKVFQFKMTPQGLRNLGKITEVYLQAQLDRQFSSLDFYHRLRQTTLSLQQSLQKQPTTEIQEHDEIE